MEASTGPLPVNFCWAGRYFEWASKISYYFNTDYGIWEQIIMGFGSCQAGRKKRLASMLVQSEIMSETLILDYNMYCTRRYVCIH